MQPRNTPGSYWIIFTADTDRLLRYYEDCMQRFCNPPFGGPPMPLMLTLAHKIAIELQGRGYHLAVPFNPEEEMWAYAEAYT